MFHSSVIHLRKKARSSLIRMSLAFLLITAEKLNISPLLIPFPCYLWHIVCRKKTEKRIRTSEVSIDPLTIAATFIAIRRIVRKLFCQ